MVPVNRRHMLNTPSLFQDRTLRRIVVGSTGLGISLMLASVAAVQFGKANALQFAWHWSIAVVMALGFIWNASFWKLIWRIDESPTLNLRKKLTGSFAFLAVIGLGTFLYPIRFVSAEYHLEISRGLITAVVFLAVMGTLIYKVGQGFMEADAIEMKRR